MFENWALKQAIKSAVKKPPPERYSLSAANRKNINYRTVTLKFEGKSGFEMMVRNINYDGICGLVWDGERFENPICVSKSLLKHSSFQLWMVIGTNQYRFSSPQSYLIAEWFKTALLRELRDRISQSRYNFRLKERNDRSKLLQDLVALEMDRRGSEESFRYFDDEGLSHIDLFSKVYGNQIWGHANYLSYLAKFCFVLDSFVESGEVIKNANGRYTISPSSLRTLAKDAVDDQRHRDIQKQNQWIILLTFLLAASAIMDIVVKTQ